MGSTRKSVSAFLGALAFAQTVQAIPYPNDSITPVSRAYATPTHRVGKHNGGFGIMSNNPPGMPYDSNTFVNCEFWWDNDGSTACVDMPEVWGLDRDWFLAMNPSIGSDCGNYKTGQSYCVQGQKPSATSQPGPTSTTPGNDVVTPDPLQDGVMSNCNKFYRVVKGDTCDKIATKNGITSAQVIAWNTGVGSDCTSLMAEAYACIGIIGGQTQLMSTTTTGSGIETPGPLQDGVVNNCNKFYKVIRGDSCDKIAHKNGITTAQVLAWNVGVGSDCTALMAEAYACVGIIDGLNQPTATTTAGNGIKRPTSLQGQIVSNCNKFYMVRKDDTCAKVASKNGITTAQIIAWNPSVGSDCKGLWADANACVGIIGGATTTASKPSSTTAGNGIKTPTPTQPGMVSNCDKFYKVKPGENCAIIAAKHGISLERFRTWNTGVGTNCDGLWKDANVCVHAIGYISSTAMKCNTSGWKFGGNKPSALKAVEDWCDGKNNYDAYGGYANGQQKRHCYPAEIGQHGFNFLSRNDFQAGAFLQQDICNKMLKDLINSCERGGEGAYEGWAFKASIIGTKC